MSSLGGIDNNQQVPDGITEREGEAMGNNSATTVEEVWSCISIDDQLDDRQLQDLNFFDFSNNDLHCTSNLGSAYRRSD